MASYTDIKLPKDEQALRDATRSIILDTLLNLQESLDDELATRNIRIDESNTWDGMKIMNSVLHEEIWSMVDKIQGTQERLAAILRSPPRK